MPTEYNRGDWPTIGILSKEFKFLDSSFHNNFLFQFLTLPMSRAILWSSRTGSLLRAMKQGVGSVRITARGMSKGRMLIQRLIRASRSVVAVVRKEG